MRDEIEEKLCFKCRAESEKPGTVVALCARCVDVLRKASDAPQTPRKRVMR